ncbi:MAG: hypothetical protein LUD83_07965, partial [Clostridiales bacterium]|nr:hypothetical protein [Clostridiales bacterium]
MPLALPAPQFFEQFLKKLRFYKVFGWAIDGALFFRYTKNEEPLFPLGERFSSREKKEYETMAKYCAHCGAELEDAALTCPVC